MKIMLPWRFLVGVEVLNPWRSEKSFTPNRSERGRIGPVLVDVESIVAVRGVVGIAGVKLRVLLVAPEVELSLSVTN